MVECNYYHKAYFRDDIEVGQCWGTKGCRICFCMGNKEDCDYYEKAQKKEKPKIELKFGEWISVKDMLPENKTYVLCYVKFEPESPNVVVENYYYGRGHWMSDGSHITHWMPLPEPPKENE